MASRTGWTGTRVETARKYWARQIAMGEASCWRCSGALTPEDDWEVDHVTPLSRGGELGRANQAASHKLCNRKAGQLLGVATIKARGRAKGIRQW